MPCTKLIRGEGCSLIWKFEDGREEITTDLDISTHDGQVAIAKRACELGLGERSEVESLLVGLEDLEPGSVLISRDVLLADE